MIAGFIINISVGTQASLIHFGTNLYNKTEMLTKAYLQREHFPKEHGIY